MAKSAKKKRSRSRATSNDANSNAGKPTKAASGKRSSPADREPYSDRAAWTDSDLHAFAPVEAYRWEASKDLALVGESLLSARVEQREHTGEKTLVALPAFEIPAAAKQQRLLDGSFEAMVTLLDVSIFVGPACLGLFPLETVVTKKRLVGAGELLGVLDFLDGGAEAVGLMSTRYATELPESVL